MNKWDRTPRAVVPSQSMLQSTVPILATRQHADKSPNGYGLAVFVIDEVGEVSGVYENRQLPMYYTSPQVAQSRGRGLQEGWYVVAELGKKFCIQATNLYSGSSKERMQSAIEIHVDGTQIFTGWWYRLPTGMNEVFKGFAHSTKYAEGCVNGTEAIQLFKFGSVNPGLSEGNGTSATSETPLKTAGCVELKIACGK